MKRTLAYGTATAVMALMLSGCPSGPTADPVEAVYGPPPESIEEPASPQDDSSKSQEQDNSKDEIDAPIEDVYGPPVMDQDATHERDTDEDALVSALYGPPPATP